MHKYFHILFKINKKMEDVRLCGRGGSNNEGSKEGYRQGEKATGDPPSTPRAWRRSHGIPLT